MDILRQRNLKRRFYSKRIKCCLSPMRRRNLKTQQSRVFSDLCLRKTRTEKSHGYPDDIVFKQHPFQNVFHPHESDKPVLSNSSGLKSIFGKLRFHDRLVWSVDLTVKVKLRFQFLRRSVKRYILTPHRVNALGHT